MSLSTSIAFNWIIKVSFSSTTLSPIGSKIGGLFGNGTSTTVITIVSSSENSPSVTLKVTE